MIRNSIRLAVATAVFILLRCPAHAHGGGPDIAFWGAFGSSARCQQVIGAATQQCIDHIWPARRQHFFTARFEAKCDLTQIPSAVSAGRQRARILIDDDQYCTEQSIRNLQFSMTNEAIADSRDACTENELALCSAAFSPFLNERTTSEGSEATPCIEATVLAASKLNRVGLQAYQRALGRIAAFNLTIAEKNRLLDRVDEQIALASTAALQAIESKCSAELFADLYQQTPTVFVDAIASRAECFVGRTYVQSTIICRPPTCGNGMRETGESCDDANVLDGDSCPSSCGIRTPTPTIPTPTRTQTASSPTTTPTPSGVSLSKSAHRR